jgi:hypothetical protein
VVVDYKDDTVGYAAGGSPIAYGGFAAEWTWETTGWIDNVIVTDLDYSR